MIHNCINYHTNTFGCPRTTYKIKKYCSKFSTIHNCSVQDFGVNGEKNMHDGGVAVLGWVVYLYWVINKALSIDVFQQLPQLNMNFVFAQF